MIHLHVLDAVGCCKFLMKKNIKFESENHVKINMECLLLSDTGLQLIG